MVLPLIFFTVSGVLLNHTEDFGLDKKRVRSEWVMERYGVSFEGEPIAYALESGGVAAEWQGQFIYNGRVVTGAEGLVGAVEIGSGICLVSKGCVYYISPSGELVEVLDDLVLPEGEIEKVGVTSDRLLVIVTEGG